MPRRYKQGADGQPHPAFYGKLPEKFSKTDTMRFMVETDLKLSGCVSADTLADVYKRQIYKWAQEDAAKGKAAPKQGIPDYSCKEGESL